MRLNTIKFSKNALAFLLLFSFCITLVLLKDNFKLAVVASFLWTLGLYVLYKNLLLALTLIFFVSAPFLYPAKIYEFELVNMSEIQQAIEYYPEGITAFYGMSISTLFGLTIAMYIFSKLILYIVRRRSLPLSFLDFLRSRGFVAIALFSCFIIILVVSSSFYSFFPMYSLNVSLEYLKILIFAVSAQFCLVHKKRIRSLFYIACLAIFSFHLLYGYKQLFFDRNVIYDSQQKIFNVYNAPEENVIVPRIPGFVGHSNRYGFHLVMLFLAVYWYFTHDKFKKELKLIFFVLSGLMLLIIQSRTAWLQGIFISIALITELHLRKREYIKNFFSQINGPKVKFALLPIGILGVALLIVPRLTSSFYFFTADGGGPLRLTMIKEGIEVLYFSPWFGFGAGSVLKAMFEYSPAGYVTYFPFEIHFAALQVALEAGMFGLLSIIASYFSVMSNTLAGLIDSRTKKLGGFQIPFTVLIMLGVIAIQYSFQPMVIRNEWYVLSLPLFLSLFHSNTVSKPVA